MVIATTTQTAGATRITVDVSPVAPAGARVVVADVFVPAEMGPRPVLMWLLPGGGMSRKYWDLNVSSGTYSFARHFAQKGRLVVAVDHLGVGESSRPDDPFSLTPQMVADVNAFVFERVCADLRDGRLLSGLAPVANLASIGCGHSMGALLTVHQQARHSHHAAICLLGFSGRGLVEHLTPREAEYADHPAALRRDLVDLTRARYVDGLPVLREPSSDRSIGRVPTEAHEALRAARANLLGAVGLSSLVPGNADPEISAIDVPVFIGHGDRDIGAPLHQVGGAFTASRDVTMYLLEESGHNHNVSPNRRRLWNRILDWSRCAIEPSDQ